MAHRALVAVERAAGQYDCYRSRTGGLAAIDEDPPTAVDAMVVVGHLVGADVSAAGVLDLLDPQTDEALIVEARDGAVTSYLVVWLGLVGRADVPEAAPAVLVPVSDGVAADHLRRTVRAWKGVLGDGVDAGILPSDVALGYLTVAVARHPDVPGEAIWLGGESDRPSGAGSR